MAVPSPARISPTTPSNRPGISTQIQSVVFARATVAAAVAGGLSLALRQISQRHVVAPPSSPAPAAPVQLGGGVDSAASGAGGYFFGVAILASLMAIFAPLVSRALRERRQSRTAAPFLLLLERPG
jgi:hypothetical protein